MGALDQLRGADGVVERARSNPRLLIAIAAGVVLFLAWIGWAIYVASSNGATAGLGVVIAWPALLAALAVISLPFIGGYLLIKRLSPSGGETTTATAEGDEEEPQGEEESQDEEEPPDEEAEEEEPGDERTEEEEQENEESEDEASDDEDEDEETQVAETG